MFFHLNVVILTKRDAGRLLAISGEKRKQTLTRFSRQKPAYGTCLQGVGPGPNELA